MSKIGELEIATQNRIVQFFKNELGYEYLGNWQGRINNNVENEILRSYLIKQNYNQDLIDKAFYQIDKIASDSNKGLYQSNKEFYSLLRYGVKVSPNIGENTETIYLIDWHNLSNNQFAIAEEVTVTKEGTRRPDIVIYINGIALGVLELKRSTVSVNEGINQNISS